jgi:hypothetical protein
MKLELSLKKFKKYSNIKLHENMFIGSRTHRQTDRNDEANSRVRNFAKAPNILKSEWKL